MKHRCASSGTRLHLRHRRGMPCLHRDNERSDRRNIDEKRKQQKIAKLTSSLLEFLSESRGWFRDYANRPHDFLPSCCLFFLRQLDRTKIINFFHGKRIICLSWHSRGLFIARMDLQPFITSFFFLRIWYTLFFKNGASRIHEGRLPFARICLDSSPFKSAAYSKRRACSAPTPPRICAKVVR